MIQAKLTVNQPGDPFEEEADRVADQVMRMPAAGAAGAPSIQRACTHCRKELESPQIQRMCSQCEEDLHRKAANSRTLNHASPAVEAQIGSMRGGGQPLPSASRSFFEPRFARDFGAVRVHTDARAAASAQSLNALAYTTGNDIAFAPGQYAPGTSHGDRLLAHELTHVAQQGGGGERIQRACNATAIGTPGDCVANSEDPAGERVLFNKDCDTFRPGAIQVIEDFADSMTDTDLVRVHGFASEEGDATFNEHLSCARAHSVVHDLEAFGVPPTQVVHPLLKHGATPGPAAQRRAVILERVPGGSHPVVPQLTAGVMATTDNGCGTFSRTIAWNLSRVSNATNGGFILQEMRFVWDVKDCNGNPGTLNNLSSPLHYFEAWRVDPGTDNISSCVITDLWQTSWPFAACNKGRVAIFGRAVFRDNVPAGALPATMVTSNPAALGGCLNSDTADPHLGGNSSRAVNRELTYHWNCCPCSSQATVIDIDRQ
jgi:outer membrane protein OmpA-like peptidoglycan-associated protein